MVVNIITTSLVTILVLVFVLFAARDISLLFRRPARDMGTGLGRVWAVAHTTLLEAWAARRWFKRYKLSRVRSVIRENILHNGW